MTNKTTSAIDLVERLEGEADGLLSAELGRFPLPAGPAANVMREAADTITRLQAALTKCADKFEEYAELHRAKLADTSSPRAIEAIMEKVMRNREMADMCRSSVGGE